MLFVSVSAAAMREWSCLEPAQRSGGHDLPILIVWRVNALTRLDAGDGRAISVSRAQGCQRSNFSRPEASGLLLSGAIGKVLRFSALRHRAQHAWRSAQYSY